MTPRLTAKDNGNVVACPECDVAGKVFERKNAELYDTAYTCHRCGADFDDPFERPPKPEAPAWTGGTKDGLPSNLTDEMKDIVRDLRDD